MHTQTTDMPVFERCLDIGSHQRIALSVTNLLDKMPPRDATWSNYPYYDTSWFDSRGRSFFLQYTHKFGGEAL